MYIFLQKNCWEFELSRSKAKRKLFLFFFNNRYGGDNVFRILVNSLCPPIFGHEIVKAGLLLGLLGGRRRLGVTDKDISIRGDPHVLVVGDPGLGKSQMLSATVKGKHLFLGKK